MKQVYFSSLKREKGPDLIYEIFALACSIYTAIQKDKTIVVIDSNRFNVDYLTESLKKYKIRVLEKDTLDYTLVAVFYGKGQKVLDITDKVPPVCIGPFNQIQGDPCPGLSKELFVGYQLNGIEYTDTYKESEEGRVCFDIKEGDYVHDYFWLDKANLVIYQDILKYIRVKEVTLSKDDHVIHILSKEDIVPYANKLNKTVENYYDTLIGKYIELLDLFVPSTTEPILLIQSSIPPKLEAYMKTKGNPYLFLNQKEESTFTEITQTKGAFIGNFNMDTLTGSACSYYLHTLLPSSKSILIDLDMIYEN
jgi:hypothetical protein